MTRESRIWAFPDQGVRVRWKPRTHEFEIRLEDNGNRYVQTVYVRDRAMADELVSAVAGGRCPVGDEQWPVQVCIGNAVPVGERWDPCGYAVIAIPFADSELVPDTEYFADPMGAVDFAMDAWGSMGKVERGAYSVMACEIPPDYPVSNRWTSCLWTSDDGSQDELSWTGPLTVTRYGNSLVIKVTDICSKLGITPGEDVDVTVRKRR